MSAATEGPSKKKQKVDHFAMNGTVGLSRLTKHTVGFTPELSPGAHHSNRVAIQASDARGLDTQSIQAFFASGRHVSILTVPSARGLLGERGKGGVYLPRPADDVVFNEIPELALRTEIQSIALSSLAADGTSVVAASDSYGRAALARMHFPSSIHESTTNSNLKGEYNNNFQIMGVEQLSPTSLSIEAGWTGVALAPDQPTQVVIARHFPKDITLFDGPMPVRTIHTTYRPNAVQLLSSNVATDAEGGPLVAVAEGPIISIWDVRASGRGARIARLSSSPHTGPFYCLSSSSNGGVPLLGAAGSERSVLIWDPRTWRAIDRWNNCLKYEATSLHFLSSNPSYCVACGLDYEVVCGKWGGDRKNRVGGGHRTKTSDASGGNGEGVHGGTAADTDNHTTRISSITHTKASNISFRGDSRWMGLAKAHGRDIVAGLTESKQLYLAELTAAS
ncbi:hypothetical protein Ndes2437B_g00735 [Nannochloris sp. 'desiccata']|nr:hypothetical protein KSW81_000123 [Chlorella desiccata (nom. nud.)]